MERHRRPTTPADRPLQWHRRRGRSGAFARDRDLEIAVRGGVTTSPAPRCATAGSSSTCRRCAPSRSILVDSTALVQGGALWGDVDHETQAHGLATTGGIVSHTGVGGLSLVVASRLMRKHGLTVDNLVEAEVVTAEGDIVRASANDHPDLFWAAGRWRELRRRQLVPVRAAPSRTHRHGRTGVLGGRGHHRGPALLPRLRRRRARRARDHHPARHDPAVAGCRRGPPLPAGHRRGQLLRRTCRRR